jgi:hypothetical protein
VPFRQCMMSIVQFDLNVQTSTEKVDRGYSSLAYSRSSPSVSVNLMILGFVGSHSTFKILDGCCPGRVRFRAVLMSHSISPLFCPKDSVNMLRLHVLKVSARGLRAIPAIFKGLSDRGERRCKEGRGVEEMPGGDV